MRRNGCEQVRQADQIDDRIDAIRESRIQLFRGVARRVVDHPSRAHRLGVHRVLRARHGDDLDAPLRWELRGVAAYAARAAEEHEALTRGKRDVLDSRGRR
jgi:hypothetical protein